MVGAHSGGRYNPPKRYIPERVDKVDWTQVATVLSWLAWAARLCRANGLVWRVREHTSISLLRGYHFNVLHRMRRLAHVMEDWERDVDRAASHALQICTESRKTMGGLLELKDNQLHCCLKVLYRGNSDSADDRVGTWVRSEPLDGRPAEIGPSNAHPVRANSVWSALLGQSDGRFHWEVFRCFACNDLINESDFCCDRANWQKYYCSTLVFPIRFPIDTNGTAYDYIGFLAFDSPRRNAFRGLPNIFEYRSAPAEYDDLLEASCAFHLGGIIADVLGTFLRPAYEMRSESREGSG